MNFDSKFLQGLLDWAHMNMAYIVGQAPISTLIPAKRYLRVARQELQFLEVGYRSFREFGEIATAFFQRRGGQEHNADNIFEYAESLEKALLKTRDLLTDPEEPWGYSRNDSAIDFIDSLNLPDIKPSPAQANEQGEFVTAPIFIPHLEGE